MKQVKKKLKSKYPDGELNEADFILMEYPTLMRRLKKIGYYISLKQC